MAEYKPLKDNVIVELAEDTSEQGIILLDKDFRRDLMRKKDKRTIGKGYTLHMRDATVVAIGPKVRELQVGDKTRVNIHNGHRFKDKDIEYLSIAEQDTELVVIS